METSLPSSYLFEQCTSRPLIKRMPSLLAQLHCSKISMSMISSPLVALLVRLSRKCDRPLEYLLEVTSSYESDAPATPRF